jgi:DNA-binding HxlR family transcriptional regulator
MREEAERLAPSILELLAEQSMLAILDALAERPLRPVELERRLPHAGHSLLMARLRQLLLRRAVFHRRSSGLPPTAHYGLTTAGRELLEIATDARRWERRWQPPSDPCNGLAALSVVADARTLAMICALAEQPLGPRGIARLAGNIGQASLMRRIARLLLDRIIVRESVRGQVRYRLTEGGRQLCLLPVRAARWEWRYATPVDPIFASDLASVVRLLTPLARLPAHLTGACHLHVASSRCREPDVYLAAALGSVQAMRLPPQRSPSATIRARPRAWCEILLGTRPIARAASGDEALLLGILGALSGALLSKPVDMRRNGT